MGFLLGGHLTDTTGLCIGIARLLVHFPCQMVNLIQQGRVPVPSAGPAHWRFPGNISQMIEGVLPVSTE